MSTWCRSRSRGECGRDVERLHRASDIEKVRDKTTRETSSLARCWALRANLKAFRCSNPAKKGHWFCYQHRRWPLLILGTVVVGGLLVPSFQSYLWGLVAPPTTVEKEHTARLEHIEKLLQDKDKKPQELKQFIDGLGISQRYPLAYALFYSDGQKLLYSHIVNNTGIIFDTASIIVDKITTEQMCISGLRITVQGSTVGGGRGPCFNMAPGSILHLARVGENPRVAVDVEALGGSIGGGAWVIGLKVA